MDRLLKIGFKKMGEWHAADGGLRYELDSVAPHPHTLYAFVVDGDVKYVGKTTQSLGGRLNSYAKPARTQATNLRNHASIRAAIEAGSVVLIYALPDEELHHYGVFHLNLAAGLEDSIIRTLKPEWNGGRKVLQEEEEAEELIVAAPAAILGAFDVILQPTYWGKGFFNTGVAGSPMLGGDGQTIEIYRGDHSVPVLGTINRTANGNGSPRIFGGKALREWFQRDVPEGAAMRVSVLSPTAIRLSLIDS